MYQVKGKWALITGAARGIGYLTARFMAEQGLQSYSKINK
jgi:short-subunit dehydrogenase